MTTVLYLVAWNVLVAAAMAVTVWLLSRMRWLQHHPALCHGLWMLVLLKLVTPTLLSVPVLPASGSKQIDGLGISRNQIVTLREGTSSVPREFVANELPTSAPILSQQLPE